MSELTRFNAKWKRKKVEADCKESLRIPNNGNGQVDMIWVKHNNNSTMVPLNELKDVPKNYLAVIRGYLNRQEKKEGGKHERKTELLCRRNIEGM